MYCNPDVCPNCQYIGEGDSWCDKTGEIVLEDWAPTENYMGPGCPYAQNKEGNEMQKIERKEELMDTRYMKKFTKAGWRFVKCALCGQRFNVGRSIGRCESSPYQQALMYDWWAKHTGQESTQVIHVDCNVELCPKLKEDERRE